MRFMRSPGREPPSFRCYPVAAPGSRSSKRGRPASPLSRPALEPRGFREYRTNIYELLTRRRTFVRILDEVLDSAELQRNLGESGRSLYERQLTWDAAWRLWKEWAFSRVHYTERRCMRFSVDAHAIGRHLTGNEVYVRNLLNGFAALDQSSEFIAYVSSNINGAESAVPARFVRRHVSANALVRLGLDLSRRLREDRPSLVHVQYTAPLACPVPVIVSVHDISFRRTPGVLSVDARHATAVYGSAHPRERRPDPDAKRVLAIRHPALLQD